MENLSKKRKHEEIEKEYTDVNELKETPVDQENKLKALTNIQSLLKISEQFSLYFKQKLEHTNSVFDKNRNEKLDKLSYFNGTLRDYQVEGVKWLKMLYENGMNGILADEMGLGKTIQIIAFILYLVKKKVSGPYLILAPLSTLPNWKKELECFSPGLPVIVFHGNKDVRKELKKKITQKYKFKGNSIAPVVISTYSLMLLEERFFATIEWKSIILDEGHKIKNHKSKIHRVLKTFTSENRIILTGTPIQNDLTELWSLLNFLMPKIFNKIDTFSVLLGIDDIKNKEFLINNEKENNLISKIHKVLEPFLLRRLKADVLTDIVPKKQIVMYCPVTTFQKTLYEYALTCREMIVNKTKATYEVDINLPRQKRSCRAITDYSNFFTDNAEDVQEEDFNRPQHIQNSNKNSVKTKDHYSIIDSLISNPWVLLKKIVDHPYLIKYPTELEDYNHLVNSSGKMLVLDAMLTKLKATGHKILLFSTFTKMLDVLEDALNYKDYKYRRLDGSLSLDDRDQVIKEFNNDPKIFIFLLSTRAGGVGLNLIGADTVIFYDSDWNPQIDIQAQDRCHRIGQTKPVMVYTLVAKNTIDEKIIKSGEAKKTLEKIVIGEGNFNSLSNIGTGMNKIDIQELKTMLNDTESFKIIESTGTFYTDEELDDLLDRSDLYKQINCSM